MVPVNNLFTLDHVPSKNKYDRKTWAAELEEQVYTIGRVRDTRWVASL